MSARSLNMPGSAAENALSYIAGKLDRIDRRTRWTGAVQSTHPAGVAITQGGATTTIASITLDPGRWLVIAGSYLLLNLAGGSLSTTTMSLLNIQGQPAIEQLFMDTLFNPGVELSVIGTQVLTAQTTIQLNVVWVLDTPTGFETGASSDTYMIAIPA